MRWHFRDLHPNNKVIVESEARSYPRCPDCRMQGHPHFVGKHIRSKACAIRVQRNRQCKAAVTSALALRHTFTVGEEGAEMQVLEQVEVFKYLGRLLAQDNDDVQVSRNQLRKARGTWARLGQVLQAKYTKPRIAAKFYKAIIQSVLLWE